jgi:uncharacterized repeat protein (TIGR04076 family)
MKPRARPSTADRESGRRAFCQAASLTVVGLAGIESVAAANRSDEPVPVPTSSLNERPTRRRVKDVTAKVIDVKGECGIHKTGDSCTFTETGVQGRICIHALYSMLPKVFAMMYGARFPWLEDADTATHACPDAANPVVFEIHRTYEA